MKIESVPFLKSWNDDVDYSQAFFALRPRLDDFNVKHTLCLMSSMPDTETTFDMDKPLMSALLSVHLNYSVFAYCSMDFLVHARTYSTCLFGSGIAERV